MTTHFQTNFQTIQKLGLGFHRGPIVSWLVLANVAVIVMSLRWWKYSYYIHLFLAVCIVTISLLATIPIFKIWIPSLPFYFANYERMNHHQQIQFIHDFVGFIAVLLVSFQAITGFITRYIKKSQNINPKHVIWARRCHIILSYGIMLLAKFNYLEIIYRQVQVKIQFIILLISDIISIIIYTMIKFKYYNFQQVITNLGNIFRVKNQNYTWYESLFRKIKEIFKPLLPLGYSKEKLKKLDIPRYYSEDQIKLQNYVLFNDFVYDTTNLRKVHPGGQFIIKHTNKRQVDRFIYGSSPMEILSETIIKKHSKDSFDICGAPVARMERSSPMVGMEELSKIKKLNKIRLTQKSSTYALYLQVQALTVQSNQGTTDRQSHTDRPSNGQSSLKYQGFTSSSQFGQYFTLSMTNKKHNVTCTRLYTSIWSMRSQNIKFIQTYFPSSIVNRKEGQNLPQNIQSKYEILQHMKQQEVIPLVIKKYQTGQFTSQLFSDKFKGDLIISRPMGGGMNYETLKPQGTVVLVSGGTGLLPFGDFIDIMFKRVKYLQKSNISSLLAQNEPVVKQDLFKNRQFYLYHACEYVQDIPPIYFFQINEVCKSKLINFKATIRISKDPQNIPQTYRQNITICKDYFNVLLKKNHLDDQKQKQKLIKVYICGSALINYQIGRLMMDQKVSEKVYHFM